MTATVATSPALASALSSDSESVADERNLLRRGQTAVTEDDDEEALAAHHSSRSAIEY